MASILTQVATFARFITSLLHTSTSSMLGESLMVTLKIGLSQIKKRRVNCATTNAI